MLCMLKTGMQDIRGTDVPLSNYRGKVLLIVNVASKWYTDISAALRSIAVGILLSLPFICSVGIIF